MIRMISLLWLVGFLVAHAGFAVPRVPRTAHAHVQVTGGKMAAAVHHRHKGKRHAHKKRAKQQNQAANASEGNPANPSAPAGSKN